MATKEKEKENQHKFSQIYMNMVHLNIFAKDYLTLATQRKQKKELNKQLFHKSTYMIMVHIIDQYLSQK